MAKVSSGSRDAAFGEIVDALWSSRTYSSYLNAFRRFSSAITLCFRSVKEALEKSSQNQDNVVCEKRTEDRCGDHGP
jgi:hypothetical protein